MEFVTDCTDPKGQPFLLKMMVNINVANPGHFESSEKTALLNLAWSGY